MDFDWTRLWAFLGLFVAPAALVMAGNDLLDDPAAWLSAILILGGVGVGLFTIDNSAAEPKLDKRFAIMALALIVAGIVLPVLLFG